MRRRGALGALAALSGLAALGGCASAPPATPTFPQGSGDLGVVVGRANGTLTVVNTSSKAALGTIDGLGDLSHASVVYARDGASAFVFGRDGAMTKVNVLSRRVEGRVQQAGNSIGGAISADGTLVAAQNYQPGGIKVFDAKTLALVADIPATYDAAGEPGKRSRVVGLAELPGRRFIYSLFDADQIWIADLSQAGAPQAHQVRQRRPPTLRRARHARRPLLHRRPVRRGRAGDDRPVGRRAQGAPHPRRLRR